jgi:hypothetical protein
MNRREKILTAAVGTFVAGFVVVYAIKTVFVGPLREIDRQTLALREKQRQIDEERRAYFAAEDYLKGVIQRSFGRDADTATAAAGKMLTDQILCLGLREADFSRMPVGPRKFRGAQEVGWSVNGEGPLTKIIDLLFVLEQTPETHRIESVVISADDRPGRVKARFRYLTLVVDAALEPAKVELKPKFTLDSPQRRYYDAIVQRDLLRPYVPRAADASGNPAGPASTNVSGARPEMLKVVSLSEWQGVPEVHLCDLSTMSVARFKLGDELLGGRIVMVDYRAMPLPDKPETLSLSRVVIKIGDDYWAVEQGQTLAAKHPLKPEQLPSELPRP